MKPIEIKHHPDGTRYVRPYLGKNAITGAVMRPYRRFPEATSDEEALELAQDWVNGLANAAELHVSNSLVDCLYIYIEHLRTLNKSPLTPKTYENALKNYIAPNVGNLGVDEAKPYMINTLYGVVMARGGKNGKEIAPNTVVKMHWFLRGAYKWFCSNGLATNNPMLSVTKPEPDISQAVAFNEHEFAKLQTALDKATRGLAESKEAIFARNVAFGAYLALWSGERCGELCANSREDAQLARRQMHIAHTMTEDKGKLLRKPKPKSKSSFRNIAIYEDVVEKIRAHYEWQAGHLATNKSDRNLMILTDAQGSYLRPSKVSTAFSEMLSTLGMPEGTSFHTLRHTHATWLLNEGADIVTIKERLGHASIATTLGLYAHVLPGRDEQASRLFANAAKRIGGVQ